MEYKTNIDRIFIDECLSVKQISKQVEDKLNSLLSSDTQIKESFNIKINRSISSTEIVVEYETPYYTSSCKYGYNDCICDPAYLIFRGWGSKEVEEELVNGCTNCEDGEWYDDEDK